MAEERPKHRKELGQVAIGIGTQIPGSDFARRVPANEFVQVRRDIGPMRGSSSAQSWTVETKVRYGIVGQRDVNAG